MKPEFLADLVDKFFDAAITPFAARLTAVEKAVGDDTNKGHKAHATILLEVSSLRHELKQLRESLGKNIWRGLWCSTEYYHAGNSVTHNAGLWVSNCDGPRSRPGEGNEWTLAVDPTKNARE